jgi:hypothetical protein
MKEAIIAIGSLIIGALLERWREKSARAAAQLGEKQDRIRERYVDILVVARRVRDRAKQLGWFVMFGPVGQMLDAEILSGLDELDRALAALRLEGDADEAVALFDEIKSAYLRYRAAVNRAESALDVTGELDQGENDQAHEDLRQALADLDVKVPELEELARKHLARLDAAAS